MAKGSEQQIDYPSMDQAATYRIRVRGCLDSSLSDRVEGMRVENLSRSDGTFESVLEGSLLDQAALTGVLNTLYELHLPMISANFLGGSGETEDE